MMPGYRYCRCVEPFPHERLPLPLAGRACLFRFSYAALPTLGGGGKGGDEDGGDILLQSINDDDEFGGSLEDVRARS